MVDVEKPTYNRFQMISEESGFWFEVIPTNNFRDRARQTSTKSSKSTEIHEIIIVSDVKYH